MKRANPNRKKNGGKIQITQRQLGRIKSEISKQATELAWLLTLAAVSDEVGLTDEQICNSAVRIDRYATYIDEHLAQLRDIKNTIEKNTGIKLEGW